MIPPLFAALKHAEQKPPTGLNKLALADVYIKAGMHWKAIEVLNSPQLGYRADLDAEAMLAAELIRQYPDWKAQALTASEKRRTSIVERVRSIWRRLTLRQ